MAMGVVITRSREEERVAAELARSLGLSSYIARYRDRVSRRQVIEGILFPRYIFVSEVEDCCYAVRKTRGVSDVLMVAGKVGSITDSEFAGLKAREDRDGFIWLRKGSHDGAREFLKDQRVRVTAGAFSGMIGIVSTKGMDAGSRVAVLLSFFGRETSTHIPMDSLEAA